LSAVKRQDPGWYENRPLEAAYEWTGGVAELHQQPNPKPKSPRADV